MPNMTRPVLRPPAELDATLLCFDGTNVALPLLMLKLIGSYALAKLLGFGLIGALVIYAILSMLT